MSAEARTAFDRFMAICLWVHSTALYCIKTKPKSPWQRVVHYFKNSSIQSWDDKTTIGSHSSQNLKFIRLFLKCNGQIIKKISIFSDEEAMASERITLVADYQQLFIKHHIRLQLYQDSAMIISYPGSEVNNIVENKQNLYTKMHGEMDTYHVLPNALWINHRSASSIILMVTNAGHRYITMKLLHLIRLLYNAIPLCAIVISVLNPKSPKRI